MRDFFEKTAEKLKNGISCYICEIIATEGSTPRGNGARMAVCADGECFGTVGGGEVEYKVMLLAKRVLEGTDTDCKFRRGESFIKKYDLNVGEAAKKTKESADEELNMVCGGTNTILFMYVEGSEKNALLFTELAGLFNGDTDTWLFTELPEASGAVGEPLQLGIYTAATGLYFLNGSGRYNEKTGRIEADSEEFREIKEFEALTEHFGENSSGDNLLHAFKKTYHAECLIKSGTVYVFGGGHVAQELVPVISHTGFRVTVVEDREEYSDKRLFAGVSETMCIPFSEISKHIEFKKGDYIVIMTRGHAADYEVLLQVARSPVRYIGLMGSKKKVALTYEKLRGDGVTEEALSKIHTPIGLPIGGKTPAEIAISVAAELIMERSCQKDSLQQVNNGKLHI